MGEPGFTEAGQLRIGYTATHMTAYRVVLACNTCGSLILATSPDDKARWTAIHNEWHRRLEETRRIADPRMSPGWSDGY